MSPKPMPTPNPQVLFTELEDGTGVLLHLDTKFYYTLNATGVVVWKALSAAAPSASAIATKIAEAFRVEPEAAEKDVEALLADLVADGLVLEARP
jgi:hypothetical protein